MWSKQAGRSGLGDVSHLDAPMLTHIAAVREAGASRHVKLARWLICCCWREKTDNDTTDRRKTHTVYYEEPRYIPKQWRRFVSKLDPVPVDINVSCGWC